MKQATAITKDSGYVIRDEITLEYYCGMNKWDKQLRKAQIYHSIKWANNFITSNSRKDRLDVHLVSMQIDDVR